MMVGLERFVYFSHFICWVIWLFVNISSFYLSAFQFYLKQRQFPRKWSGVTNKTRWGAKSFFQHKSWSNIQILTKTLITVSRQLRLASLATGKSSCCSDHHHSGIFMINAGAVHHVGLSNYDMFITDWWPARRFFSVSQFQRRLIWLATKLSIVLS